MGDHVRKQIRVAAAAQLTGLATTGARVFVDRARRLQPSDLPALKIYLGDENIDMKEPMAPRLRERQLVLVVEAVVAANTAYDDTMDQIVKEVENALDANNGLGGLCKAVEPHEYPRARFGGDADTVVGSQELHFMVLYYTRQSAPDTPA
jgi:hypothetical protein